MMPTYTIRLPDDRDPGSLAFLDIVEPGASGDTLIRHSANLGGTPVDVIQHSRLGVTIERTP